MFKRNKKNKEPKCKCYICGKPMSLADWWDTPCCISHITDQLKDAIDKSIMAQPAPEPPAFTKEAFDELIEKMKVPKYIVCAPSDEVAEGLKELLPYADIRKLPELFIGRETSDEVVYIIPAEPKPVKIVFERNIGDDWENWGY